MTRDPTAAVKNGIISLQDQNIGRLPKLTFKYALTCLLPSMTQGNILVLSVTTVYNKLSAAPSTSSFPVGADGSDLMRYMMVVK